MSKKSLYNVARRYIEIIEVIERTSDKKDLVSLEEQRVIWHNRFIEHLKKEGIPFRDRDHATLVAYRLLIETHEA